MGRVAIEMPVVIVATSHCVCWMSNLSGKGGRRFRLARDRGRDINWFLRGGFVVVYFSGVCRRRWDF